mmetsp:Transcript_31389/g.23317  ORF Transcript_31389/g.23317 Transcript_31389/m.23317 type:complete len:154 (-) Transcript_31389:28-489(-)
MPPKIYFSDADKQRDLSKKPNSARKDKPKALKAQSSKKKVIRAFKPKINTNTNSRPPSAKVVRPQGASSANVKSSKPTTPRRPIAVKPKAEKGKGAANTTKTKLETALQTASSVMRNKQHKNHNEVQQLVEGYKKKWIPEKRFLELLPKLVFG